ncbi:hypothetical protein MF271_18270 (plasmid) [Deinococcus sp. KNUC1210]|uniref:hypothetical protein n=1 Tax=Deinococcus sp. KNUC1210 TaxID=2917691 RepID=UPI001EF0FB6F|nr:hypothetical protein [Deinococcus sp. KNUC1210]ULH17302.1 hypothetical protein MF271_18270 [Deinococcus sp. KNUC1210]
MTADRERTRRVLRIALSSPYEGEREKSVGLVLQLLQRSGLRLCDIDASFGTADGELALRTRARLAASYQVSFRSREEALFYLRLFGVFAASSPPPVPGEDQSGYILTCYASPDVQARLDAAFHRHTPRLQGALAAAQEQALREYQARRRELFRAAVEGTAALAAREGVD